MMVNIISIQLFAFCAYASGELSPERRLLVNDPDFYAQTFEQMQLKLRSMESEIAALRNTVSVQNNTINSLSKQLSSGTSEPGVAFMAIMDKDLHNISSNHIIIFNHVMTNVGGAYNPNTGTFIAPVSGTYFFSLALSSPAEPGDHHSYIYMKKDGADIGYLFFDNHNQYWVKRTETVTVHANKGESVFVIVAGASGMNDIAGQIHSNFSGFLIKAD